jgi:hypothetical protein
MILFSLPLVMIWSCLELPPGGGIGYTPSGVAVAPGTGDNMAGGLPRCGWRSRRLSGDEWNGLYDQSADPRANRDRGRLCRCNRRIPPGVHALTALGIRGDRTCPRRHAWRASKLP